MFGLVCLMRNVRVNIFSVMLGRSHRLLGITEIFFLWGGGKYVLLKNTTRQTEWGSIEGDWISDRFEVFLAKISSVERSDYYLECMNKLTQRTVMEKIWRSF